MTTFRHESASAVVLETKQGEYSVGSVMSRRLRQGHATALMGQVCDWADDNNAVLFLIVQRYSYPRGEGMNNHQLIEFYSKFGFQLDSDYGDGTYKKMVRQPSQ